MEIQVKKNTFWKLPPVLFAFFVMGFVDVVMFNPILVRKDSPYKTEEGCLSLPGIRKTTRYQTIEVEYLDMNWKKQNLKLDGWTAQICQHELDHWEGILI